MSMLRRHWNCHRTLCWNLRGFLSWAGCGVGDSWCGSLRKWILRTEGSHYFDHMVWTGSGIDIGSGVDVAMSCKLKMLGLVAGYPLQCTGKSCYRSPS